MEGLRIQRGEGFRCFKRSKPPSVVVIHESVSSTRQKTIDTLKASGYGVHFIVDEDASITGHTHEASYCIHAGYLNRVSIGIEVVNPYYGLTRATPDDVVIPSVWAHRGNYIVPKPDQLEATWLLVQEVCDRNRIPVAFSAVKDSVFRWGRLSRAENLRPGVVAHASSDHSDGGFVVHYCVLRARGFEPTEAYELSLKAGASGKRETALPVTGGSDV